MNHKTFCEKMSLFRDGRLSDSEVLAFNAHLTECRECQTAFGRLKQLSETLLRFGTPPAKESFVQSVMDRLAPWQTAPSPEKSGWKWPEWVFPALGYAFALTLMTVTALNRLQPAAGPVSAEDILILDMPEASQTLLINETPAVSTLFENVQEDL